MEDHNVMRVIEVLGKAGHILPRESVCAVNGLLLTVRPVHPILRDTRVNTRYVLKKIKKKMLVGC